MVSWFIWIVNYNIKSHRIRCIIWCCCYSCVNDVNIFALYSTVQIIVYSILIRIGCSDRRRRKGTLGGSSNKLLIFTDMRKIEWVESVRTQVRGSTRQKRVTNKTCCLFNAG